MGYMVRFLLSAAAIITALVVAREAFGEVGNCAAEVWYGAQQLQPWYKRAADPVTMSRRAKVLQDFTEATCSEAPPRRIWPRLAVALAFRESSIVPRVGLGKQNGLKGERGYWQVMPGGKAESYVPRTCSQHSPICNAKSAMSYLAHLRDAPVDEGGCGSDDPYMWIGAYGRGHCPSSPEAAREWEEVRVARRLYCQIEPDCDTLWPE